jgi:hypothetical protein
MKVWTTVLVAWPPTPGAVNRATVFNSVYSEASHEASRSYQLEGKDPRAVTALNGLVIACIGASFPLVVQA